MKCDICDINLGEQNEYGDFPYNGGYETWGGYTLCENCWGHLFCVAKEQIYEDEGYKRDEDGEFIISGEDEISIMNYDGDEIHYRIDELVDDILDEKRIMKEMNKS